MKTQDLVQLASSRLYPNYGQPPLVLDRGEGVWVWDTDSKRYLDLYAGIAVSTLGHAHPRLVSAIVEQAGRLLHVSNYYYNEPNILLADKLCAMTGMDRALFCNSGTEANEAQLKLARRHFFARGETDRYRVIAFESSFHGRTLGSLAATGQAKYRDGFGPLSGVTHVPFGDAEAVSRAMAPDVAAILVEPVQGEGGVIPAPEGFLGKLRELADAHGALLLLDEVQTGVGRTGRFLAVEHDGVRPDAVALAKGLGGGIPIGAMLCSERLSEALPPGSHGSTFGGNALASTAALTVLEVLEDDELVAHADELGAYLAKGLQTLVEQYPTKLTAVRGRGLLQAVCLAPGHEARELLTRLREAGVLATAAGADALRFSPPLIAQTQDIDQGLRQLSAALKEL